VRSGDVCDVAALGVALTQNEIVGNSWATVQGIDTADIEAFLEGLTPVVLLRDTLVTDHGFENGRILPQQTVLQRGNAVLVDRAGMPRVRCLSGSPLRRPQALPDTAQVTGAAWIGFSFEGVVDVPPAQRDVQRFVLIDIRTGEPLVRESGASGAPPVLAGPVVVAAPEFVVE
jgi:hypothetical protein